MLVLHVPGIVDDADLAAGHEHLLESGLDSGIGSPVNAGRLPGVGDVLQEALAGGLGVQVIGVVNDDKLVGVLLKLAENLERCGVA
jgi:hypothetical protein